VVLFGYDVPDRSDEQAVESKFKEVLSNVDRKYKDAKIEIWRQNQLIGFLRPFLSLALRLSYRSNLPFRTHKSWSQQAEMRSGFNAGKEQENFISSLQAGLREGTAAVHIRVYGEPGIGKTRLVLEATRTDDLSPLVIYCDSAGKFRDSNLMNELLKDDNSFSTIMVLDECDPDSRAYIWDKFKHLGSRIKVVSIYNEHDATSGNITYLEAPPLGQEQIIGIIQGYGIQKDQAERWAELCSGSPRVAHMLGQNLLKNPEDVLKPPDTVDIWERYVTGGDDATSIKVQQRRVVLRHIALFKRFGCGGRLVDEAKRIAKMVEKADPQITWARFQEIVQELRHRKILQGETTLYITPKALHIWLWKEWWNTYGPGFNFEEFSKDLPGQLQDWFCEMFKYAELSGIASQVVENLLGQDGPFQKGGYLKTELGSRFFGALAEAAPVLALKCLENTIGTWSKDELMQFKTSRSHVRWALEKIAVWRETFAGAARLLLALGEAENEGWSNNASGVFAGLFSHGYSLVAPTEASPEERFPILKEALESASKERRLLALRACEMALQTEGFIGTVTDKHQGLKKEPSLWMPKTWGEIFDAYRRVWQLLREKVDTLSGEEQQQAVRILLDRASGVARMQNLSDMVIDTVTELAQKPYVERKNVIAKIVQILHYDRGRLPKEVRQRWEQLKNELTGRDFSSLLKRYVGMSLIEDVVDSKGKFTDTTQPKIESLAQEALENGDLLKPELHWLVTEDAQNGFRFGYELGKKDKDFSLLSMLLHAQRSAMGKPSAYFLGGYFRSLFEKDQERWEKQLDLLAEDEKLIVWVPEVTWRSGLTDRAALRILSIAEKGFITIRHFRLFGLGTIVGNISENVFKKWIEFVLASSDIYAGSVALDLYYRFYLDKDSKHTLPEEMTLRVLTHESLFQKAEERRRGQMDDYYWTEIGKSFVTLYSERSLNLADKMLRHFGEDGTIVEGFHSQPQELLDQIVESQPVEAWKLITAYIGLPMDVRAFHIMHWLQGSPFFRRTEGALSLIPLESIWKWVDADVERRAPYLAEFVPKAFFRQPEEPCVTRELLMRYGARKDVRDSLIRNFLTEGWHGPASLHYQEKKQEMLKFRQTEDNENVKRWIDEYVDVLNSMIERERIEEERDDL